MISRRVFELVYLDKCGPFSRPDVNGEFYFQTYIYDYSRMTFTFLIKDKSHKMDKIDRYVKFMSNKGHVIEILRTYQGTDYNSI